MRILRYSWVVLILLSCTASFSQFDQSIKAFIPATPTSGALAKHAEINLNNGKFDQAIDMFAIKDKKLRYDVDLRYYPEAIRVSETSPNTGYGFTVGLPGVITRSLRMGPDEKLFNEQLYGFFAEGVQTFWFTMSTNQIEIVGGKRDLASDIYFLNVDNIQGAWFFDEQGNIHLKSTTDLKIEVILTGYSFNKMLWKITTPDGAIYYFGDDRIDGYLDDAVSHSQDEGGFQTDVNNTTVLPIKTLNQTVSQIPEIDLSHLTGILADKTPDADAMVRGMMTTYTNPLGGRTVYTYQAHDYYTSTIEETFANLATVTSCSHPFANCPGTVITTGDLTIAPLSN